MTISNKLYLHRNCFKSLSWSSDSCFYNYLCNQCLSPLTLWVRIPLKWGVLVTTLCDKACQWLTTVRWFSLGTPVSSTNKTDRHDITKILLKVALNIINQTKPSSCFTCKVRDYLHTLLCSPSNVRFMYLKSLRR
jgi:hypothetical protein